MIREKPWDLILVLVLTVLLLGVIFIVQIDALQIIFGLVFIIFLPGYGIVSAMFPKADDINTIERIALSFGLSIAVVPLIGLLLNYTPWGIRFQPILISLFIFIISVSIIAWYRRIQLPVEDRFTIVILIELPKGEEFTTVEKILSIILVISVIIAFIISVYVIIVPKEGERFTEFYILDENGTAENYPTNLTIGDNGTVIVGVICHEHDRTKYIIEIDLNKLASDKGNILLDQYNFSLEHNQRNESVFNFNVSENGTYKLQFFLYINKIKEPYRELHLWINVNS